MKLEIWVKVLVVRRWLMSQYEAFLIRLFKIDIEIEAELF